MARGVLLGRHVARLNMHRGQSIPASLAEARIFIDWSDAATRSRRFARNQNAPVPSNNLIAFPTGSIVNESGGATPARTNFYADVVDPGGTNNATRVVSTAINQVLYFVRAAQGPLPPSGTYTLRFRARANVGTGPWACSFGFSGGYAAGSIQDLDWTDPANLAATTFEATFTYNGVNDIALRLTASGADVIVDRIQLYEGSSAPAWADEVFGGGRLPYAFENSLTLTAQNGIDQTAVVSGMVCMDPAFPAKHTYSGYTVMTVSSIDAIPSGAHHIINQHSNDGGTTTANLLQVDSTAPYSGEVNTSIAAGSSRSQHAFNVAGDGVFIAGHGRSATQHVVWSDTVPSVIRSSEFAGLTASRWTLAGWASTNIAGNRLNLAPGDYHFTAVWDRLLTQTEWKDVANYLRGLLVTRGVSNLLPFTDFHVISGDSNSTRATNDWTQLVTADGYLAPQRNLYMALTSVGGQGVDNIEATRFDAQDAPALLGGIENERYSLYHLPIGTNDWDLLNAYPGSTADQASAYCARLQTGVIADALALHARVHVMWYSLLPQTSTSRPNWETQRLLVNSEMITWASTQDRVHVCDFGGSATIGDRSLQAGGGGTYYLSDEIHFSSAGDVEAAAISGQAVKDWRTALGIHA